MQKPAIYIVLMTVLLFIACPLSAGDPVIMDIKPPGGLGTGPPAVGPDLKEGQFDGVGVIDRITNQEIVIDDHYYHLSAGAVYKYLDGRSTTASNFPVGTRVWFVLYADNIIESVWKEGG